MARSKANARTTHVGLRRCAPSGCSRFALRAHPASRDLCAAFHIPSPVAQRKVWGLACALSRDHTVLAVKALRADLWSVLDGLAPSSGASLDGCAAAWGQAVQAGRLHKSKAKDMNAHLSLNVTDAGAVLLALECLCSKNVASKLYKECGGSASRIVELARIQNGAKWARLQATQVLHEWALLERAASGPALEAPHAVRELLPRLLGTLTHQVFCALFLDNRHRLIAMRELLRGPIEGAPVHPREVVKEALAHNAAAVLLAHNHPSQVCEPSQADELIAARLREALALVGIRVPDHFVVGGSKCMSFAERGLI